MRIRVGLENNLQDGRSLAWALDYPGCFAYGNDGSSAVISMGKAVPAFYAWLQIHCADPWLPDADYDIRLVETWETFNTNDDFERVEDGPYEVNAWFWNDWKPLTTQDVDQALHLLEWSRADLLAIISGMSDAQLDLKKEGQRWPIRGILKHIGSAEWWYLHRLGLAPCERAGVPEDYRERLDTIRAALKEVLPSLVGVNKVVGIDGEFWSPRKLVRRAIWHEIDHIRHILELMGG